MQQLDTVILFLIDQTSKSAKRYSQREFDERGLGITVDQWVLLMILLQHGPMSQRDLAVAAARDEASITRSLALLETRKLIDRERIPENRRQYNLNVSVEGKEFILSNMEMVQRHRAQALAGFTETEIETLRTLLLRMQDNLR